jgi:hypothetical protein
VSNDNGSLDNMKKLEIILESLKGKIEPTEEQLKKVKELAKNYSGKSEEELVFEIIKLNKMFSESMGKEEYQQKIKMLERIRPLLTEEQQKKLDKLLDLLKQQD